MPGFSLGQNRRMNDSLMTATFLAILGVRVGGVPGRS